MIKLTILVILLVALFYIFKDLLSRKSIHQAKKELSDENIKGEALDIQLETKKKRSKNSKKQQKTNK